MAFGVQAFNSVGDTIFDTTQLSQTQVTASGTWANTVTLARATGEMICLGIPNTTARRYKMRQVTGGIRNDSGVTVNYVKLSAINEQTPSFAASYGIETFDASGNLSYSSNYTQGFKIRAIYPEYSLSGLDSTANPSTVWTSSLTNIYFTMGGCDYGTNIADNFDIFVYESGKVKYANSLFTGFGTIAFNNKRVVQVIEIRN